VSASPEVVPDFGGRAVLVVGDLMLDRYEHGQTLRVSPEAPVPVLRWSGRTELLGGAANTAANCAALGLGVRLVGVVGDDPEGERLAELARAAGIAFAAVRDPGRPTTLKTRVVATRQQLLRIDRERVGPLEAPVRQALLEALRGCECDFVLVSDYGKGVVDRAVMEAVLALGRPVLVDPKSPDLTLYRGAAVVKPNLAEAARALGCEPAEVERPEHLARLLELVQPGAVLLTRGAGGLLWVAPGEAPQVFPTTAREVFDVTGAGDTIAAVFAAVRATGGSVAMAARLANAAAGRVIQRLGTAVVSRLELAAALRSFGGSEKLLAAARAAELCAELRQAGKKVVFTNGCFDLLHAGHVHLLRAARDQGDFLIVGLNSDASVRRLKGAGRPVTGELDRIAVLAGLQAVDAIVPFEEDTPAALIALLQPDVLVKGADYTAEQVVGAEVVYARGGRVHLVPLMDGRSTSAILARR